MSYHIQRSILSIYILSIYIVSISLCFILSACQEVEEPTAVLTQQQWNEVEKQLLKTEPQPKYKLGAHFEDKIELIGFDVTEPLIAGQKATFTWYWRAKEDIKQNWKIFVHMDASHKVHRQNLDHHPVQGLYQTSRWKKGQIIKDVQEVTMQANYPDGQVRPYIGLYKNNTRLKVVHDGKKMSDNRTPGPTLQIKNSRSAAQHKTVRHKNKPRYTVHTLKHTEANISIDGTLDEEVWRKTPPLRLKPFARGTYDTWAKIVRTQDTLYIAAYLADNHIWGNFTTRDSDTWKEEVLEIFIDPNGDAKDYLELQITPNNVVFDAHFVERLGRGKGSRDEQIKRARAWNMEGLTTAVHVDGTVNNVAIKDRAWTVEIQMPLLNIPGVKTRPKPEDVWAVNLYRFDRPDAKTTNAYAWSTKPKRDFHEVSMFGELQFASNTP